MVSKHFVSLLMLMATGPLSYAAPSTTTRELTFQEPAKATIWQAGSVYSVHWVTDGNFNETHADLYLAWRELNTGLPDEGGKKPHGTLQYLFPPLVENVALASSSINVEIPAAATTGSHYHLSFRTGAEHYPSHLFTIKSTAIPRNLHA